MILSIDRNRKKKNSIKFTRDSLQITKLAIETSINPSKVKKTCCWKKNMMCVKVEKVQYRAPNKLIYK